MSRFLKIMIVLLTIAAIAAPVMAEDRLGLSGQMRVRGWYIDDGGSDTSSFMDQRLRVGGKLSVAEGVSITFRTDITESTWGSGNTFGSGRTTVMTSSGGYSDFQSQHWDRAHIDLQKNNLHLRAGQQYIAFGKSGFDAQSNGLTLNVKGAIPVTAFWMLNDNNTGNSDSDDYYYGLRVAHKGEMYSSNLFVAGQTADDEQVYVLGATLDLDLDAINLYGEAEFFSGDASATVDATGLQLFLDASMAASEMATVGGQFYYAQAADSNEWQYSYLGNDFGGWDPLFDVGTGLSNEKIGAGRPWDFTGDHAGVIAGRLYANVKASDAVALGASVSYLVPEDDANTKAAVGGSEIDSAMGLAAGLSYAVMSNTKLDVQVEYIDVDAPMTDEVIQAGVGLFVNF